MAGHSLKRSGRGGGTVHAWSRDKDGPRCASRILRHLWFRCDDPVTCEKCLALEGRIFRG